MPTCPHGNPLGPFGIALEDVQSWEAGEDGDSRGVLEFYSACDCCDTLMHSEYYILADGKTLCCGCYEGEELMEISE